MEVTTDTAASRSTIKSIHAFGRCLAGNTRVPVKEDAIEWGNWPLSRNFVHVPSTQCTVEGNVQQLHRSDFRMASACMFQLGLFEYVESSRCDYVVAVQIFS